MKLASFVALAAFAVAPFAVALVAATQVSAATAVAPVVVDAGPGPKLVQSFPVDGSTVPGGVLVLKITFDQTMAADGWSYAKSDQGAFPDCLGQPRMLADQRTFVLLCTVAGHGNFAMQINAQRAFTNDNGRSAQPTVLHFSTGDLGVFDLEAALSQASLTPDDDPIMRWSDKDAGASSLASKSPDDTPATAKTGAAKDASAP